MVFLGDSMLLTRTDNTKEVEDWHTIVYENGKYQATLRAPPKNLSLQPCINIQGILPVHRGKLIQLRILPLIICLISSTIYCAKPSEVSKYSKNLTAKTVAVRYGFEPDWVGKWPRAPNDLWQFIRGHSFNRPVLLNDLPHRVGPSRGLFVWNVDGLIEITIVVKFRISELELGTEGNWGLLVGGLLGNWQVYLNDKTIGSSLHLKANKRELQWQSQIRSLIIEIDRSNLRLGDNIVTFRVVGDKHTANIGLYPGNPLVVGKYSLMFQEAQETPMIALLAIYMAIGCYHLILFLGRRKNKHDLYFSAFCFLVVVYNITRSNFVFQFMDDTAWLSRIEYAAVFIVVVPFFLLIDLLFYSRWTLFSKIYTAGAVVLALVVLIPSTLLFAERILRVWQISGLVCMIYFLGVHIRRPIVSAFTVQFQEQQSRLVLPRFIKACLATIINTSEGNLFLGLMAMIGTATWDILDSIFFLTGVGLTKYGFTLFVLGMAATLANKSQRMHLEIESLNIDLERQIKNEIRLKDSFARFVPTTFLRILGKKSIPEVKLGDYAEKKMTIMFADIRSFTSISEKLSPKQTFDFINNYLKGAGPIIRKYSGFIDKYMGDGIMALFEEPGDAIAAALRLQARNARLNSSLGSRLVAPLKVGIGIHTGHLMLGTIGERQRMDGTVIADAVNLASRIESLTKHYGVSILVTKDTLQATEAAGWNARFIDRIAVKGKATPSDVYEISPVTGSSRHFESGPWMQRWETGIEAYFAGNFVRATELFAQLIASAPDDQVAALYLTRCSENLKSPPPLGWNGVTVATSK
jgi:adenylate cyclase